MNLSFPRGIALRSYGHIDDHASDVAADMKHRHIGSLIGAALAAVPASLDYSSLLSTVPDQGGTSSCVGQALATSVYLRAKFSGYAIARPSAKAIYDVARLEDGPRIDLRDEGSRPAVAIRGMMTYGLVSDAQWPLSVDNVNMVPPLDVFVSGLSAQVSAYYRIESGAGAATLARQALASGFFPIFAMDVDSSYERMSGQSAYDGPTGPILGGHAQCLVGYDEHTFLVAGSWGPGFAADGFARITDGFLERGADDLLVATTAPLRLT